MIEEQFITFLNEEKLEHKFSDKKYKIKFTDKSKDELAAGNEESQPVDY